jgi:putative ABC transport system permease protein
MLTRFLQSHLFNVRPTDPSTTLAVLGVITLVALVACYLPASRATRVDPMVVLRDE